MPERRVRTTSASDERRALAGLRRNERELVEDLLRALLECEHSGEVATDARLAGLMNVSREVVLRTLAQARNAGLASTVGRHWVLEATGREIAVLVMRAHRLTETRLARESSVPAGAWHDIAHSDEHTLSREDIDRLADRLGNPRFDPHGDPIPTREGRLPEREGDSLLAWPSGRPGVISHIEDEPPKLFARIAAAGVFAGMRLTLHGTSPTGCDIELEARRLRLPLELAALVRVRPLQDDESPPLATARRLSELPPGQSARILGLLAGCIGPERSRLLDLGFVPGSSITFELRSPFRGPVAYRVRGTLVALRPEQADHVLVDVAPASAAPDSSTAATAAR